MIVLPGIPQGAPKPASRQVRRADAREAVKLIAKMTRKRRNKSERSAVPVREPYPVAPAREYFLVLDDGRKVCKSQRSRDCRDLAGRLERAAEAGSRIAARVARAKGRKVAAR